MKISVFLLCLLTVLNLHGQMTKAKMDSLLNGPAAGGFLSGDLLIAAHGQVLYERAFGKKSVSTTSSSFALASVSKQFTSVAVIQLKEKGKLKLDDPFIRYFPGFPYPSVTIRHLLTHTSGLPDYELFDRLIAKEPGRIFTNKDIIPALREWDKGLYFKPGDDWQYSNMNYCLLALLVEKLSGQAFQGYLSAHIFKPAGMGKQKATEQTANYEYPAYYASRALPVDSIPAEHQMVFNLGGFYGQGGLTATAEDLLRFDNAFFGGLLINKADMKEVLTPVKLNNGQLARAKAAFGDLGVSGYGMGWFILDDTAKGKIVFHDGGRPGIASAHLHNLRTDQTVIMLENFPERCNTWAVWAYLTFNGVTLPSPGIPLIYTYTATLVSKGPEAAAVQLQYLRKDPLYRLPDPQTWVASAYQLFGKAEYVPLSVESMRTASLCYPDNWYVSQAYAAALELAGKKDLAILMYKKSIAENPRADYAIARLKLLEAFK